MTETIETLAKRLDRLEKVLETVTLQLSYLVDELVPNAPGALQEREGNTYVYYKGR